MSEKEEPRTYGGWRVSRAAGVGRLTASQVLTLVVCLVGVVITNLTAGWGWAALELLVMMVGFAVALLRDRHGMSPIDRWREKRVFNRVRRRQANLYRGGALAVSSRLGLPGVLAGMRVSEHEDGYRRRFGLVHHADGRMTVVMSLAPVGEELVDRLQVDRSVALFGLWLADLAEEAGITDASVSVETGPETGEKLRRQVHARRSPQAPGLAVEAVEAVVAGSGTAGSRIRTWATISFAQRKGGVRATISDIATRLPGLTQTLSGAGAGPVHLLTVRDLAEMVRVAYDPAVQEVLEQAVSRGEELELDWASAGPAVLDAEWDRMRHDSGLSRAWVMTSPPRGVVQCGVLRRLLAVSPEVERKRVTIMYRPLDAARAPDVVEADVRKARAQVTATREPTERMLSELAQARRTSQEEASGAGIVDFGMVVTATVSGERPHEELEVASAVIENLAGSSRLLVRPAYGAQDSAFALGLPLGLTPARQSLTGGW